MRNDIDVEEMIGYLCMQLHHDWSVLNLILCSVQKHPQTLLESLCWTSLSMQFGKCPEKKNVNGSVKTVSATG